LFTGISKQPFLFYFILFFSENCKVEQTQIARSLFFMKPSVKSTPLLFDQANATEKFSNCSDNIYLCLCAVFF